ncbi:hypothetical protein [Micromonospora sp. Llam0]|uniref:hypothetical protein n=1 Tax=Micromonospora sp. Llam0 TaxID=2485143 RepID=UPI001315975C|nr:hypothetical protein [Micromonospora sp. Llam0]
MVVSKHTTSPVMGCQVGEHRRHVVGGIHHLLAGAAAVRQQHHQVMDRLEIQVV